MRQRLAREIDTLAHSMSFLQRVASLSRDVWATFDLLSMHWGLAVMFFSTFVIWFQILVTGCFDVTHLSIARVITGAVIGWALASVIHLVTSSSTTFPWIFDLPPALLDLFPPPLSASAALGSVVAHVASLIQARWASLEIFERQWCCARTKSIDAALTVFLVVLHSWCLFSNSYIEALRTILAYLLQSVFLISAVLAFRSNLVHPPYRTLGAVALAMCIVRLALEVTSDSRHETSLTSSPTPVASFVLIQLFPLSLLPSIIGLFRRQVIRPRRVESRFSRNVVLVHSIPSVTARAVAVLCPISIALFWLVQLFPHWQVSNMTIRNSFARAVYILGALSVLHAVVARSRQYADRLMEVFQAFLYIVVLLSGPSAVGPLAGMLVIVMLYSYAHMEWHRTSVKLTGSSPFRCKRCERHCGVNSQLYSPGWMTAVFWLFLVEFVYFNTGHAYSVSSLHFEAAFIGFDKFDFALGTALVALNTFGPYLLMIILVPLQALWWMGGEPSDGGGGRDHVDFVHRSWCITREVMHLLLFVAALCSALTMLFVYITRRHLMVWRVFAPKYLFDICCLVVVDCMALLMSLFLSILSSRSNERGIVLHRKKR